MTQLEIKNRLNLSGPTVTQILQFFKEAGLLREGDEVVYGDSAYLGLEKRDEVKHDPQLSTIEYRINRRPGRLPKVSDNAIDWERYIENRKSAVRCKVEHPYRIVKNIFGFRKTVYRGLRKNLNRLHMLFCL